MYRVLGFCVGGWDLARFGWDSIVFVVCWWFLYNRVFVFLVRMVIVISTVFVWIFWIYFQEEVLLVGGLGVLVKIWFVFFQFEFLEIMSQFDCGTILNVQYLCLVWDEDDTVFLLMFVFL